WTLESGCGCGPTESAPRSPPRGSVHRDRPGHHPLPTELPSVRARLVSLEHVGRADRRPAGDDASNGIRGTPNRARLLPRKTDRSRDLDCYLRDCHLTVATDRGNFRANWHSCHLSPPGKPSRAFRFGGLEWLT